jgi:DNA-binding transcriptional regulator PaaX
MAKATIAVLHATEEAELTAAIKQLKESGQIEQLGQKRGARYRLSPAGLAAAEAEGDMD